MNGIPAIRRVIAHRYPLLLVDRVLDVEPGRRIVAVKAVSGNEPWYGRLPDDASDDDHAYPVALLVESWCQTALLLATWDSPAPDRIALFGGISGIEVSGRVWPGDVLRHTVLISRQFDDTWIFEGSTTVAGRTVLTVEHVLAAVRPRAALGPVPLR